jgi:hypothetical protein
MHAGDCTHNSLRHGRIAPNGFCRSDRHWSSNAWGEPLLRDRFVQRRWAQLMQGRRSRQWRRDGRENEWSRKTYHESLTR